MGELIRVREIAKILVAWKGMRFSNRRCGWPLQKQNMYGDLSMEVFVPRPPGRFWGCTPPRSVSPYPCIQGYPVTKPKFLLRTINIVRSTIFNPYYKPYNISIFKIIVKYNVSHATPYLFQLIFLETCAGYI